MCSHSPSDTLSTKALTLAAPTDTSTQAQTTPCPVSEQPEQHRRARKLLVTDGRRERASRQPTGGAGLQKAAGRDRRVATGLWSRAAPPRGAAGTPGPSGAARARPVGWEGAATSGRIPRARRNLSRQLSSGANGLPSPRPSRMRPHAAKSTASPQCELSANSLTSRCVSRVSQGAAPSATRPASVVHTHSRTRDRRRGSRSDAMAASPAAPNSSPASLR
jgi:hypothetical protein